MSDESNQETIENEASLNDNEAANEPVKPVDSILDKVLESKKVVTATLDPEEVIQTLINQTLDTREQAVLKQRHGLENERITLEEIGKKLGVTRERVRQIAKQALKKLADKKQGYENSHLLDLRLKEILENYGGLREEESLLNDFFGMSASAKQAAYLVFFLDHLSEFSHKAPFKKSSWQLVGAPANLHGDLEKLIYLYLDGKDNPQTIDDIHDYLDNREDFSSWQQKFQAAWPGRDNHVWKNVIEAYLELSEIIAVNPFAEWGLATSPLVKPKRMGDKIYLVLKKNGKPIHFNDITGNINEYEFDHRKAYAPTVHNELILDGRFVLVGRGIYALREWGYQEGTVADVLARILNEADNPLTREELIESVLKERMVKEGTIHLALTNRSKFKRLEDGSYTIV